MAEWDYPDFDELFLAGDGEDDDTYRWFTPRLAARLWLGNEQNVRVGACFTRWFEHVACRGSSPEAFFDHQSLGGRPAQQTYQTARRYCARSRSYSPADRRPTRARRWGCGQDSGDPPVRTRVARWTSCPPGTHTTAPEVSGRASAAPTADHPPSRGPAEGPHSARNVTRWPRARRRSPRARTR